MNFIFKFSFVLLIHVTLFSTFSFAQVLNSFGPQSKYACLTVNVISRVVILKENGYKLTTFVKAKTFIKNRLKREIERKVRTKEILVLLKNLNVISKSNFKFLEKLATIYNAEIPDQNSLISEKRIKIEGLLSLLNERISQRKSELKLLNDCNLDNL